ncbi:hypothetical protein TSL6_20440 [Sulfurovum sp. TSL6]|uniref:HNH endonuclease n=1 Tax=Sulfurovum sp. TSL6 TaxID=2826995 RepID=UPI001CC56603|nr:HNH endonuclease [Sulfurovum sp. TSL6]GIU01538.1 hypothetical protein TSL6_20440 [Sulfurovum sp. TSL6]
MYHKECDGSIVDISGKYIFFSFEKFINDICHGNCCFICGAKQSDKNFNDEHVIPNWILRKYKLHRTTIELPGDKLYNYGHYKIPCCEECNSLMGQTIEEPIRDLLHLPFNEFVGKIFDVDNETYLQFVNWLYLIFLKTHLKDTTVRLNQDRRKGDGKVSSLLDLKTLHHIHCMARAFYTKCTIDKSAFPMLNIFHIDDDYANSYDYADLSYCTSMMMQIDEKCIIFALDDSGMATYAARPMLDKVAGNNITPIQAREILARIGFANFILKERPVYHTMTDPDNGSTMILGDVPDNIEMLDHENEDFGMLFYQTTKGLLEHMVVDNISDVKQEVKEGLTTFLVDEDGQFNTRSMIFIEDKNN